MKIKLKIWQKIIIFILGSATIIFTSIFVFISLSSRKIIYNDAIEYSNAVAKLNANKIENWLNSDLTIARTLSNAFLEYKALPQEQWLDLFRKMYNRVYAANPQIDAIRDSWELSNLDPKWDKPFGRHFYLVYHENGVLKIQRDIRSLTGGDPVTYGIMKNAGCESISEPYVSTLQKGILKTTLASPLYENGKYIGLVGVDIVLSRFQELVKTIKPFHNSYAFLLSNKGVFTAHPDTSFFERTIVEKLPELVREVKIIERVQRGEEFNFFYADKAGENYYYTMIPIIVGKTKTPWSLGIVVPEIEMLTSANSNYNISLIAGVSGLLLLIIILSIFTKNLTDPINKITNFLKEVAKGKIDTTNLNIKTGDEIEVMADALSQSIEGLNNKTEFAKLIGSGNLECDLNLLSEDDVLGKSLIEMRDSLQRAHEEDEKRKLEDEKVRWANLGLAKFSEILRQNNNNLTLLGDEIIKNIVWYLDANQGGLFVINDKSDKTSYDLVAAFAYDRKKYLSSSFALGEGLIGTCAAEKEIVYLTEIPQDYIEIESGLGSANPNALLLVPLKIEQEVLGVIELASFNKFESYEIDFVQKLGESIASTLRTVKVNSRTTELLEKSQEQAEMMSAQEEEMRQNMEEMQATQEEMRRKEDVMKHILKDMEVQENDLRDNINKIKGMD